MPIRTDAPHVLTSLPNVQARAIPILACQHVQPVLQPVCDRPYKRLFLVGQAALQPLVHSLCCAGNALCNRATMRLCEIYVATPLHSFSLWARTDWNQLCYSPGSFGNATNMSQLRTSAMLHPMATLINVKSCEMCANQLCYSPARFDQGIILGKIAKTVATYYKHM